MELEKAIVAAEAIKQELAPWCDRIEIAGSIRRKYERPRDIEIVCIRRHDGVGVAGFVEQVNKWQKVEGSPTGKNTRRIVGGHYVDIFMCAALNWGLFYMIRTGSEVWVRDCMLLNLWEHGQHYYNGGFLWRARGMSRRVGEDERVETPEEADVFRYAGLEWREPEERDMFYEAERKRVKR